eukprot:TRINITY_DN13692_c0_g1_i1.p1 TRINITY_DN13692_c0_g1~~TRINITY_DN13692_c0_g1_i1.p1  ORF type:complete len:160 (+),score=18.52 TRINITY_DN13692_c0_g1_i1:315-794(+)
MVGLRSGTARTHSQIANIDQHNQNRSKHPHVMNLDWENTCSPSTNQFQKYAPIPTSWISPNPSWNGALVRWSSHGCTAVGKKNPHHRQRQNKRSLTRMDNPSDPDQQKQHPKSPKLQVTLSVALTIPLTWCLPRTRRSQRLHIRAVSIIPPGLIRKRVP